VGDDDQSIYRFRGADITNILNFEKDYPNAKVIKLEQNYRSTQNILGAAGAVVSRNVGRKPKELWTRKPEAIGSCATGQWTRRTRPVSSAGPSNRRWTRDGAFARSRCSTGRMPSPGLSRRPAQRGLPYRIFGGLRFYDRKEIKDIIAYLRVAQNPADIVSLRRIINVPARGIGDTTVEKLERAAALSGRRCMRRRGTRK